MIKRKPKILRTTECEVCSKKFSYYETAQSGKYCSIPCKAEGQKVKRQQQVCAYCGCLFIPDRGGISRRFCSLACSGAFRRLPKGMCKKCGNPCDRRANYCSAHQGIALTGEKSLLWKGGISWAHRRLIKSPAWKTIRGLVLQRDGFKCALCDKANGLQVHHIVSVRDRGNENPSNLITLCQSCHRKAELNGYGDNLAQIGNLKDK